MYAVCVTFKLKPGSVAHFLPLMLENAKISLEHETECHQFDVLTDGEKPDQIFLYELYTDRAAFDAHLSSAHFQAFDAATTDMIARKDIQTWDQEAQ